MAHNPRSAPSDAAADHYFDAERYRQRMAIERTNAWLDSFCPVRVCVDNFQ